jgi:putative ABC transport system permease protein
MPLLPRLTSLWRNLFQKDQREQELREEIRAHLEMLIELKIKEGLDPAEARRKALIEMGGEEQVKESAREARIGYHLETWWRDLCYALRMLRRNPGFTAAAVLTLGLGIGANAAIFTLINALLFRPPAVRQPERLVTVNGGRSNGGLFSYRNFQDYNNRNQSFDGLAASMIDPVNVGFGQQNEMAVAEFATAGFFAVLGVNAVRGRVFTMDDGRAMSAPSVAVIGYGLWRRLGADQAIVGKTIAVNQGRYAVVGVAAESFKGTTGILPADVWIPLEQAHQYLPDLAQKLGDREAQAYQMLGRLKPGVSLEQARAEMQTIDQALDQEFPRLVQAEANRQRARPISLERLAGVALPGLKQQVTQVAMMLMAVVGMVLLLACANVANLLLARGGAAARNRGAAIAGREPLPPHPAVDD